MKVYKDSLLKIEYSWWWGVFPRYSHLYGREMVSLILDFWIFGPDTLSIPKEPQKFGSTLRSKISLTGLPYYTQNWTEYVGDHSSPYLRCRAQQTHLDFSVYIMIPMYIIIYKYLFSIYLPIHLSIHLSIYLSICVSACLLVCLPHDLSLCPSVCLSLQYPSSTSIDTQSIYSAYCIYIHLHNLSMLSLDSINLSIHTSPNTPFLPAVYHIISYHIIRSDPFKTW